jgi:uncharacterized phage-associated protein
MAPYPPHAVANWFLEREPIDQMKLHKLVYFAHGWNLGLFDQALIDEEIEAWDYGPVVPSLYHEFKEFGSRPITEVATKYEMTAPGKVRIVTPHVDAADSQADALLRRIAEVYGRRSGPALSALTHLPDSPWTQIRQKYPGIRGVGIPNDLIRSYFREQARRPSDGRGR